MSNVVSAKIICDGEECNAWDTANITINIPKSVNTDNLQINSEDAADSADTVNTFICQYWDRIYNTWKTDGCYFDSDTDTHFVCKCSHTTEFSVKLDKTKVQKQSRVDPNPPTPTPTPADNTTGKGGLTWLWVLASIVGLFVIAAIAYIVWVRFIRTHKDAVSRDAEDDLEGNEHDERNAH